MSLDLIRGQNRTIEVLKSYIKHKKLAGGYLFAGPGGVGKIQAAWEIAKTVNCLKNESDACGQCPSCLKIENNRHPDIHLIESKTQEIKIESIRSLQKEINLRPYEARVKVFIINDAHKMNAESSNAILKILEEPPKDSLIILITDKPSLLFGTIISRCKILKFFPLPRLELKEILKQEYRLTEGLAHFLAYFSEGRLGFALELKDKDILAEKNRIIDGLALSQRTIFLGILAQDRDDVRSYLNILAAWFRDIYLIKAGISYAEIINLDRKDELLKLTESFSFVDLDRILHSLSESVLYLEQNINLKLILYNLGAQLWKA